MTRARYQRIAPHTPGAEITAIDLTPGMLERARKRAYVLGLSIDLRLVKVTILQRYQWLMIIVLFGLLSIACGVVFRSPQPLRRSEEPPAVGEDGDIANGERIYFTATNDEGDRISYRGGPDFGGMMMGSYLTCAACHGPEAGGGTHWMHMQVMDAPDIRYIALQGEAGEHGGDEHGDEGGEYTLEDFRLAVIEGKHPDGETLSRDMPRWEMDDQDLADLFDFLKSLP